MIDPREPDYIFTPVSPLRSGFHYVQKDSGGLPCVSIVTPFFNVGSIFHETAQSVLQQSFQQWEWVIVNDGSTDRVALEILEHYRHRDERIRVVDHGANRGQSAARNTGFGVARTELVVQLDADDLLEPTAVEKWLWFLESFPEYAFVNGFTVGFGAKTYLWTRGFHDGRGLLRENLVDVTSMVRRHVFLSVGGYDEMIRGDLEDWDFWLKCANAGHWGATIPEYLDWYRRRADHAEQRPNWKDPHRFAQKTLRPRYPKLWEGQFAHIKRQKFSTEERVQRSLPWENLLQKRKPRLLMIVPWLTMGGADKFNLDLTQQMVERGFEVTIATTLKGDDRWHSQFTRYTPDVFVLHHFLRIADYPRFLNYLIRSRQTDLVMVSNSELGYHLLPFLRANFPEVTFVDYCHMEEEWWKNGGYPRLSIDYQDQLDLTLVTSRHLQEWKKQHGGDPERIDVCTINVDSESWAPNPQLRKTVRKQLGLTDETLVILYIGRLCLQKQPGVFAKVMARLRSKGYAFVALVVGDGEEQTWLENFITRQHLSGCVRLLGAAAPKRVQELMTAGDIFFMPSTWEGIALTLYEAMATGLAVVAADVGGQRELVTNGCGILLPRGTEESEVSQYVDALAGLLSDPSRRAVMGDKARKRICNHFRIDLMGENMVRLFGKARHLHDTLPRANVGPGSFQDIAPQALAYIRLYQHFDGLWFEESEHRHPSKAAVFYTQLKRIAEPFYYFGIRQGWRWLVPVKDLLKHKLRVH